MISCGGKIILLFRHYIHFVLYLILMKDFVDFS